MISESITSVGARITTRITVKYWGMSVWLRILSPGVCFVVTHKISSLLTIEIVVLLFASIWQVIILLLSILLLFVVSGMVLLIISVSILIVVLSSLVVVWGAILASSIFLSLILVLIIHLLISVLIRKNIEIWGIRSVLIWKLVNFFMDITEASLTAFALILFLVTQILSGVFLGLTFWNFRVNVCSNCHTLLWDYSVLSLVTNIDRWVRIIVVSLHDLLIQVDVFFHLLDR